MVSHPDIFRQEYRSCFVMLSAAKHLRAARTRLFAARRRDKLFPILLVKNHHRGIAIHGARVGSNLRLRLCPTLARSIARLCLGENVSERKAPTSRGLLEALRRDFDPDDFGHPAACSCFCSTNSPSIMIWTSSLTIHLPSSIMLNVMPKSFRLILPSAL
jgi:hypothetical protein